MMRWRHYNVGGRAFWVRRVNPAVLQANNVVAAALAESLGKSPPWALGFLPPGRCWKWPLKALNWKTWRLEWKNWNCRWPRSDVWAGYTGQQVGKKVAGRSQTGPLEDRVVYQPSAEDLVEALAIFTQCRAVRESRS